jgi:NitT/TauT family transport system ATP-binding protein
MPPTTALDLRQICHRYPNGLQALAPLDLSVRRGEFVSIVGPSGCGKSTLLRLIAGLLPTSAGDVERDAEIAARTAFVFQSPALMPWANVVDNVRLPLTLAGNAGGNTSVGHALQTVGLQNFHSAYPRELSGGMQMRVSIARALATRPRLLLMDEPFAALDEITRSQLDDDLLKLWSVEALTVIFVTHSIYEAVFLSTRIVVMSARPGRIVGEVVVDEPSDATTPRSAAFRSSEKFVRCSAEASRLLQLGMRDEIAAKAAV